MTLVLSIIYITRLLSAANKHHYRQMQSYASYICKVQGLQRCTSVFMTHVFMHCTCKTSSDCMWAVQVTRIIVWHLPIQYNLQERMFKLPASAVRLYDWLTIKCQVLLTCRLQWQQFQLYFSATTAYFLMLFFCVQTYTTKAEIESLTPPESKAITGHNLKLATFVSCLLPFQNGNPPHHSRYVL